VTEPATLTIREVAGRTGVPPATLRMWETRHRFPAPTRLASGHRRYSPADCEAIERVLAERARGLSLQASIERVVSTPVEADPSLFATLRRAQPALPPQVLPKRALTALSRAIEDEIRARADRPLLFAAFQRERFFRASERRWRELARTAELAVALADFERSRVRARGGVCELPLPGDSPLAREWALICDGERLSVALTAWEQTAEAAVPDAERRFEMVWTVEPSAVRRVAVRAAALAARIDPELIRSRAQRLEAGPAAPPADLANVMALMHRAIAYLAAAP
jgi:MerR family transcriptional regulator, light-induced transcriptional regulator